MKRECKTCTHYVPGRTHEAYTGSDMSSMIYGVYGSDSPYCLKHRSMDIGRGCDDFWPKDSNPRCDECRFSRPSDDEPSVIFCYHTNGPAAAGLEHFCENWRARG